MRAPPRGGGGTISVSEVNDAERLTIDSGLIMGASDRTSGAPHHGFRTRDSGVQAEAASLHAGHRGPSWS